MTTTTVRNPDNAAHFMHIKPVRQRVKVRHDGKVLAESIDQAVVHAHHLQIDKPEFLRLAEGRFEALAQKRARASQG